MLPYDVMYFNDEQYNETEELVEARIYKTFPRWIITDPSQWHVAVERFEVNLNTVPIYTPTPVDVANDTAPIFGINVATGERMALALASAFSLAELISLIQKEVPLTGIFKNFYMWVDEFGYVYARFEYPNVQITLEPRLALLLGLGPNLDFTNTYTIKSKYSRVDCGVRINHVLLRTDLPVESDVLGQAFTDVLTDVAVTQTWNVSMAANIDPSKSLAASSGIGINGTGKLTYEPSLRRFTNMRSKAPIQMISVSAWYTNQNKEYAPIMLGQGMGFSVKLGFYKRKE